jgi:ribosome maturation factor RimP
MHKNGKIEKQVRDIVQPLIEQAGFELVDIEYQKEGNNWVLRFFIDHEKGIDHRACELVSNIVGDALDKHDPIPHSYLLEVSSPGIERPLKSLKDFQRFSGEKVRIKLFSAREGQKDYIGKLLGVERDQVAVSVNNQDKFLFNMDEIAKAHLMVDF